jgi:hypothetical protein
LQQKGTCVGICQYRVYWRAQCVPGLLLAYRSFYAIENNDISVKTAMVDWYCRRWRLLIYQECPDISDIIYQTFFYLYGCPVFVSTIQTSLDWCLCCHWYRIFRGEVIFQSKVFLALFHAIGKASGRVPCYKGAVPVLLSSTWESNECDLAGTQKKGRCRSICLLSTYEIS